MCTEAAVSWYYWFLCQPLQKSFKVNHYSSSYLLFSGVGNEFPDDECDPGYYCPGGQTTAAPVGLECLVGHYCPMGSWEPLLCDNGTYNYQTRQSECEVCPAGYYCDPIEGKMRNRTENVTWSLGMRWMSGILIFSHKLKEVTNSYVLFCLGTSKNYPYLSNQIFNWDGVWIKM